MKLNDLLRGVPEDSQRMLNDLLYDIKIIHPTPRTIFVILVLKDGFEVYGSSSCADIEQFDENLGVEYAFRHAVSRLYKHVHKHLDNQ